MLVLTRKSGEGVLVGQIEVSVTSIAAGIVSFNCGGIPARAELGQIVQLGSLKIEVLRVWSRKTRLGFAAPGDVPILRLELSSQRRAS